MNPDQQQPKPSGDTNEPLFNAPFNPPLQDSPVVVSNSPPEDQPQSPPITNKARNKLLPILVIASVLEFLIILILLIVVASGSKTTNNKNDANSNRSQSSQAATSTGVQLTDDALSQDISNLNDDKDFPTNKFDDKSLGL